MPINIYRVRPDELKNERVAYLCPENWQLSDQAEMLENWLVDYGAELKPADYVADLGFTHRKDALGGGAAISPEAMQIMAELGMWLFLSEYSNDDEL